ncbi:hypothetical protein DFP72DRAFT_1080428 [Ephemerocybe angulata]|uniref:Uncharacterized protein n=1 Tax=Ephemerocybe angulata TaxID=980116 RepID=A0A8H6HA80_9AGAR|nr:hypothetical protein DFP72DRAFT_1080428 [Tulosesus angulatus]
MKLEEKQWKLSHLIEANEIMDDEKRDRCRTLTKEIKTWRKRYIKAIPAIEEVIMESQGAEFIEDEPLHLPSHFTLKQHQELSLLDMSIYELKMHEGYANVAATTSVTPSPTRICYPWCRISMQEVSVTDFAPINSSTGSRQNGALTLLGIGNVKSASYL